MAHLPIMTLRKTMEEAEVKDILLSLVESNRNKPYYNDHIGNDVIGWRFPDEQSNANNEEYKMPVCQWSRVSCDVIDGSVTVLDLGDGFLMQSVLGGAAPTKEDEERAKNIGGARHLHERHLDALHEDRHLTPSDPTITITIPSSLGKITSLRKIDLSSNQIQGTIPQSVTDIPNLEHFDVSSNDLIGTFPRFTSDALRVLDISKNRFHGTLPVDLFGHYQNREREVGKYFAPYLSNLVKLDISHNGFNGTIPLDGRSKMYDAETGIDPSLHNVVYFDMGYNLFSGTICNNFGNLASLQGLFLEHNRLVGTIPKALYRGSGIGAHPLPLAQLFLQQNELSGTLPSGLSTLPNLRELFVDGNKLTGDVPDSLCKEKLNDSFLLEKDAAEKCDGVVCPANSLSQEGVAPCTQCPNDGGFHRYIGQRGDECRKGLDEVGILDALFYQTHGEEWKFTDKEKNGWTKGSPACQRKGVVCNESGLVTQINLSSMGLKGPLPTELGHLSNLLSLNLAHNKLTGFLPSDLRFLPLTDLDIRDNRMDGRVPPLLCIKEGLNHNGVGPPGIDFNLLYSCDNIVCGRGFWSPIGRASLDGEKGDIIPTSDGDGTLQCRPCFDDQAMLYMGRVQCTDMVIGGFHIREVDIDSGLFKIIVAIPVLVFLAAFSCMGLRRRKSLVVSSDERRLTRQASSMAIIRQRSSSFGPSSADGLSGEAEFEDYYSDDDWTAADSEGESKRGYRDSNPMIELAPQLSEIEETPSRASSENGSLI